MSEVNLPVQSGKTLIKALTVAIALAGIIFVTVVLPAEYNIDPTGLGETLGLTVLATGAAATSTDVVPGAFDPGYREDQTTITVPARTGLEYKFHLQQYEKLNYEWDSGEVSIYFDLHGEPDNDNTGFFESFAVADASKMRGTITAPFAGSHGWFWRNGSSEDVLINLKTQGNYELIGLK